MAAINGFDENAVPAQKFEPVPTGDYVVVITDSEARRSERSAGYLWRLQIVDGPHAGRKLTDFMLVEHANQVALNIASRKFASLKLAANVPRPQDTCKLHNIPIIASVRVKKRKDSDEWENDIVCYSAKSATSSAPQQQATGAAPWARQ